MILNNNNNNNNRIFKKLNDNHSYSNNINFSIFHKFNLVGGFTFRRVLDVEGGNVSLCVLILGNGLDTGFFSLRSLKYN